jgi:hypothetical protein
MCQCREKNQGCFQLIFTEIKVEFDELGFPARKWGVSWRKAYQIKLGLFDHSVLCLAALSSSYASITLSFSINNYPDTEHA